MVRPALPFRCRPGLAGQGRGRINIDAEPALFRFYLAKKDALFRTEALFITLRAEQILLRARTRSGMLVPGEVKRPLQDDRTRLLGGEGKVLREVDSMAVFVQDHLGVLGIVHAALAKAQLVLGVVGGERVVLPPLIDPHRLRPVADRPQRYSEAEAVDVPYSFRTTEPPL